MHSFQRQENILCAHQKNACFFSNREILCLLYKNRYLHLDVRLYVNEWAISLVCQQRRAHEQRCFVLGRMYRKWILNVMYIVSLIFFRTCLLPIFAAFLISSSSFFSSLSNSLSIKIKSQVHFFFKYGMICNSEEPSVPLNISGHFPQRLVVCSQLVWDGNKSQLTAYQPIAHLINWCRQDVC